MLVERAAGIKREVTGAFAPVTFDPMTASRHVTEKRRLDHDEITALYSAYGGELWRALLAVSAGRTDLAKEAMAEAFARLVARADSVQEPRAWLYRVGYRAVIDELRRERKAASRTVTIAARDSDESALSEPLTRALASLSPDQRLAVFLTYQADLPLREVAELTGATVTTVKVRLHRARRALRGLLEEEIHA
jgi:RNA polymerase sigma-70 factor (ECF subfamily)